MTFVLQVLTVTGLPGPPGQSALQSVGRADTSCKFLSGDRILAINGISLENCTMERADSLLDQSGNFVNFIISRKLS